MVLHRSLIDVGLTGTTDAIVSGEVDLEISPVKILYAKTDSPLGTYVILVSNFGHGVPSASFTEYPSEYRFHGVSTRFRSRPCEHPSSLAAIAILLYFLIVLVL